MEAVDTFENKRFGYLILSFLNQIKNDSNVANVELASQSISQILNIHLEHPDDFKELSCYPVKPSDVVDSGFKSLNVIPYSQALSECKNDSKFQPFVDTCASKGYFGGVSEGSIEYLQRNAKLIKKFREKTVSASTATATPETVKPAVETAKKFDAEGAAEEKKLAGNEAIKQKNYELAVQLYSEALQFSSNGPNSHIYYANRSAAYCHLGDYRHAVSDCESSIRKCPTYAKAHSRLGLAHFFLGNYSASVNAYQAALDLEPDSSAHKESLTQAKLKLQEHETLATSSPPAATGLPGGMPDLSSMLGANPGMMQMAQQMMQNPTFMAQAQQMMQNPSFMAQAQQMMQNPDMMRQMMSGMGGGGGGGMPDLSQLAAMMGNTNGSSDAGIPPFSGFSNNN
jgi:small glutamine-rich tetratricopeptide repeat-containing protein alpha